MAYAHPGMQLHHGIVWRDDAYSSECCWRVQDFQRLATEKGELRPPVLLPSHTYALIRMAAWGWLVAASMLVYSPIIVIPRQATSVGSC